MIYESLLYLYDSFMLYILSANIFNISNNQKNIQITDVFVLYFVVIFYDIVI